MAARLDVLTTWVNEVLRSATGNTSQPVDFQLAPASEDASFRRYFRVTGSAVAGCFDGVGESLIVMDAPPDKEDSHPFVIISGLLTAAGLGVPQVFAKDFGQGFLLLSDLGAQVYLDALNEHTVESLYADALDALFKMQRNASQYVAELPVCDETLLLNEMALFDDWYCQQYRGWSFTDKQRTGLDCVFQQLCESALVQPQVFVHRDYHSRNLMVTEQHNPGILDFQDAVFGPVTYDLVSLLRDCYIDWPRPRVEQWALGYLHRVADAGLIPPAPDTTYLRWFDWMGVQRHLKAAGIFARLHLRDNKPGYLADIPRTLAYVRDVSMRYPELKSLHTLLADLTE
ncbi:MAG: phosphotransferase [Gammaproteobacteria bacterium]|nr:phosphotransferase [Gammaproteobacteria bacterium]